MYEIKKNLQHKFTIENNLSKIENFSHRLNIDESSIDFVFLKNLSFKKILNFVSIETINLKNEIANSNKFVFDSIESNQFLKLLRNETQTYFISSIINR